MVRSLSKSARSSRRTEEPTHAFEPGHEANDLETRSDRAATVRSLERYYFDLSDDMEFTRDESGIALANDTAAADQALSILGEMVKDAPSDMERNSMRVEVRKSTEAPLLVVTVSIELVWAEPEESRQGVSAGGAQSQSHRR